MAKRRGRFFSAANDNDLSSPSKRRKSLGPRTQRKNIRGLVTVNRLIEKRRLEAQAAAAAARSRRQLAGALALGVGGVALGYGAYRGLQALKQRRAQRARQARLGAGRSG